MMTLHRLLRVALYLHLYFNAADGLSFDRMASYLYHTHGQIQSSGLVC
jgi:hypothetical protein